MTDRPDSSFPRSYAGAEAEAGQLESTTGAKPRWALNLVLFVVTLASVFFTAASAVHPVRTVADLLPGWTFAVPMMSILLVHEFGHYVAARIHRVEASLPYFLPLPVLSPFGTLGAVIAMRGRIRSRNALLDIGASGPLAGLVVAIPMLVIGLSLSPVLPSGDHYYQEGQSLLYVLLKWLVVGPIPEGHDVHLHPTAFAGWGGLLVTMLNLLPWGQLDGGHIAYALFGEKQNRLARYVRLALVPIFFVNLALFAGPVLLNRSEMPMENAVGNSMWWLMWFLMLSVIARISGGAAHPPVEPSELSPARRAVAWLCIALFVLLFIPTAPLVAY